MNGKTAPMNILIADDHILFRDTIYQYIRRAQPLHQIKMASGLNGIYDILNEGKFIPDLCIVDFKMPGMNGHKTFGELISLFPSYPMAVMSGVAEPSDIKKVLEIGAIGFLPKTLSGRAMLNAIETMLEGKKYIPYDSDGINLMPTYFSHPGETDQAEEIITTNDFSLTPREKEVLGLLSRGKSNREIANDLKLQTVTVKLHLRSIYRKLDCDNRTKAVLKARDGGLVD